MNIAEYHQKIEKIWLNIEEQMEEQGCDVDCETQGSVFTITFEDCNQIVINKQEPLLELWLASRSGGFHFSFKDNQWITSDGVLFWDCLEKAILDHGEKIHFVY